MTPNIMLFCLTVIGTLVVFLGYNAILALIWTKYWHQTFYQGFWQWSVISTIMWTITLGIYLIIKIK